MAKAHPNEPVRTCIGCRQRASRAELLRVVAVEGELVLDPAGRLPGRGAHLHRDLGCLDLADRRRAFNRALRTEERFYAIMASEQTGTLEDDGSWYFTLDMWDSQFALDRDPDPLADIKTMRSVALIRSWNKWSIEDGKHGSGQRSGARRLLSGTWLCRAAPEADRSALEEALIYLETHGIGIGAERGYGTVRVCDPFHLESDPL